MEKSRLQLALETALATPAEVTDEQKDLLHSSWAALTEEQRIKLVEDGVIVAPEIDEKPVDSEPTSEEQPAE